MEKVAKLAVRKAEREKKRRVEPKYTPKPLVLSITKFNAQVKCSLSKYNRINI